MYILDALQGKNKTASHQKQNINASGTAPLFDVTEEEMSGVESQEVGKETRHICVLSTLQNVLAKTKNQVHC